MKVLITGASGYLGSMLTYFLSLKENIEKIYALDVKEPKFLWKPGEKIIFLKKNLVENWEEEIKNKIDAVFHLAFWIRRPFFNLQKHLYENSFGFEKLLNFCEGKDVKKLIIASSIAVYGANKENSEKKPFKEDDELREKIYLYGKEKIELEKQAQKFYEKNPHKEVIILRLVTVTGPFAQKYFRKSGLLKFMKEVTPFIFLSSENSLRQYVHEDDVISAFLFVLEKDFPQKFIIFNIAPSSFLYFKEIAKITKKKIIRIPYQFLKILFSLLWYFSLGKIPTAPGSENSYTFPIFCDGSKIEKYGFQYKFNSLDAFLGEKGFFENLFSPKGKDNL